MKKKSGARGVRKVCRISCHRVPQACSAEVRKLQVCRPWIHQEVVRLRVHVCGGQAMRQNGAGTAGGIIRLVNIRVRPKRGYWWKTGIGVQGRSACTAQNLEPSDSTERVELGMRSSTHQREGMYTRPSGELKSKRARHDSEPLEKGPWNVLCKPSDAALHGLVSSPTTLLP